MRVGIARVRETSAVARGAHALAELGPRLGRRWVQFDDAVLVWDDGVESARAAGLDVEELTEAPEPRDLRLVVQVGQVFQQENPDAQVLLDKGRYLVVAFDGDGRTTQPREEVCFDVRPLPAGTAVLRRVTPTARDVDPVLEEAVGRVKRARMEADLGRLAGLPTRHSLSAEFASAASWARGELAGLGYTAREVAIDVHGEPSVNIVADRGGAGADERGVVVVCAHLDSINNEGGPSAAAPGADDNGSGAVALLEMARVLAPVPAEHDLRLVLFGGEEQGLFGSRQHVAALAADERARVRAVVNMDMVATRNTPERSVLLEGATRSHALIDELAAAAATYTSLGVQVSLEPFASDHVPFLDAGMPAVLTIEGADRGNGNVHTAGDTLEHIDYELALEIVRMNVAAAVRALRA